MRYQISYNHLSDFFCVMRGCNSLRMNHVNLNIYRPSKVFYIPGVITTLSPAESKTQTKDYNKPPTYPEISPHSKDKIHPQFSYGISPQTAHGIALIAGAMLYDCIRKE
ncbi:hypothetical protein [Chitinophaga sp. CF418]|uniref:hypothetical protein n=1 Tax=Chitinophaga sp. CF418 TaxID=1855287 RepID=UPI0009203C25|nr:hypothetical protein [Chitinophaga sp. CF418]SHN23455.1 hypothetical protein SAMN05216311_107167 [Chitinophaga sp. CF418]